MAAIAESAALFFRGSYPFEAPHFCWGDTIDLPWIDEYWTVGSSDDSRTPLPIADEISVVADRLVRAAQREGEETPWSQITFRSVQAATEKSLMQGLAVEAMLCAENCLVLIAQGAVAESLRWMAAAYANIIECVCLAQRILGMNGSALHPAIISQAVGSPHSDKQAAPDPLH